MFDPNNETKTSGYYVPSLTKESKRMPGMKIWRNYKDENSIELSTTDLLKLHLQMKQSSEAQIQDYIRSAYLWDEWTKIRINETLRIWKWKVATPPRPNSVAGPRPAV